MTTATATCYRQVSGLIQAETGWLKCPKSQEGLCCHPGDDCLDEQICHNPSDSTTNGSGYYIGLCLDATYESVSCSSRCTDDAWGDVVYNSGTSLWACCGTNTACDKPTNETFLAPPPQQLLAAASSRSASATTATSTRISGATVTVTSAPSAMTHQISSLSGGAKAGIGVGAALAAVAIIALLAWVILLRKRLRSHGQARYSAGRRDGSMISEGLPKEMQRDTVREHEPAREHELSGYGRPHEMEGRRNLHPV